MFQIDLAANGELRLWLPGGRTLEISSTPTGLEIVKKIIYDYEKGVRQELKSGYIGTLPTQHAVDKFLKNKAARIAKEKAEEVKDKASKLDIDWDKLEITL